MKKETLQGYKIFGHVVQQLLRRLTLQFFKSTFWSELNKFLKFDYFQNSIFAYNIFQLRTLTASYIKLNSFWTEESVVENEDAFFDIFVNYLGQSEFQMSLKSIRGNCATLSCNCSDFKR